jgi:hypothetical protein
MFPFGPWFRCSSSPTRSFRPRLEALEVRDVPSAATAAFAEDVARSPQGIAAAVTREFELILNRAPDTASLGVFANAIAQGVTLEQLDAALLTSAEYVGRFASPTEWARGVTVDLLGPSVDPTQAGALLSSLAAGVSPFEATLGLATSVGRYAFEIEDAYQDLYGRPFDAASAPFWVSQLQNGLRLEDIRPLIAGSDEFLARHGGTPDGFIQGIEVELLRQGADDTPGREDMPGGEPEPGDL